MGLEGGLLELSKLYDSQDPVGSDCETNLSSEKLSLAVISASLSPDPGLEPLGLDRSPSDFAVFFIPFPRVFNLDFYPTKPIA